jgi:hypothetical protein
MEVLKHVQPGQPIGQPSAFVRNAFVDAALDHQRRRASQGGRPQISGGNHGVVLVRNDSGGDCGRYFVLGIDEPIITPTDNLDEFRTRVAFSCVRPDAVYHFGKFVILLEPLASGAIGRGLVSGVCPVAISTEDGQVAWADVDDDSTSTLRAAETGSAKILWMESESAGTHWAIVQLGAAGPTSLWGVLVEELTAGGSALVTIWDGAPPMYATARSVEAHDWLLSQEDSLPAGTKVKLEWIGGYWWVTGATC